MSAIQQAIASYGSVTSTAVTWNPLDKSSGVSLNSGDLGVSFTSSFNLGRATSGKSSGKWYWETTISNATDLTLGVANSSASTTAGSTWVGNTADSWGWFNLNGFLYTNNTAVFNVGTYAAADVLGFALDMVAGTITFYKNNVSVGSFSGLTGTIYPATGNFTSTAGTTTTNFGATAFVYAPPAGHIALT